MSWATIVLFAMFFLLLFSSAPIAIVLGLTTFAYFYYFTTLPLTQVPSTLFHSLNYVLIAVPFFVLAANIMSEGGISRRLIDAANSVVGSFRGGLAMSAVLGCMFFAAISGSSSATVVAIGSLLIPAMIKNGYGREFPVGLVSTSGSLGILIPPSIPLIVYGVTTEQSIGDLFIAGVVPGILAGLMLLGLVIVISRRRNLGGEDRAVRSRWTDRLKTIRDASLSLFMPIFVLGGIYGGLFTPTEAAAAAVLYSLIVSLVFYREIGIKDLPRIFAASARTSAMLMFIIANGILFTFLLTRARIPDQVANALLSAELSQWSFLLVLTIILLIAGCFMETSSAILILAPIFLPVAIELGVNPIHLGVIMVMNLEIGMITPPVGLNLFMASGISGMSVLRVAKAAIPSAVVLLAALLLVIYIPEISLIFVR